MTTPRSVRSPLSLENDRYEFQKAGASIFTGAHQDLDTLLQSFTNTLAQSNESDDGTGQSGVDSKDALTSYEIRLGSTRLSLAQLKTLKAQDIVTLTNATPGKVQIWHDGVLCGLGALLIVDGKLAVRVESVVPNAFSAQ
ncbi:MAG: FliM/FliN family flagellar motor C-terminal domain-containing protein [Planctomycetia bacterium]|nr:FliM/FliN family flagellar motor C-terminal domain-containing protein [Planctomycetia bacterium]